MNEKKLDWHLFWTAAGVVLTLSMLIIGCFYNLAKDISEVKSEIVKIQTVLILKNIAPPELFAAADEK